MAKKNLQTAIKTGADLFFSGANEVAEQREAEQAYEVSEATEAIQPHKAQDESPEALQTTIAAMQTAIAADAAAKLAAAEARQTQGKKGCKMPRMMLTLTPSAMEYVKVMAGITGKSQTRYISDLVEKDAEANRELYDKAKELMKNAR